MLLAQLLQQRGVVAAPENMIRHGVQQSRNMPDVIVNFRGLRLAIEGEVSNTQDAHNKAIHSAQRRVENGLVHIGVAVVYPAALRQVDFTKLQSALAESELSIAIITESNITEFMTGTVVALEQALRTAFEHLVQEDVVAEAVNQLDSAIEVFATALSSQEGTTQRIARVLGVLDAPPDDLSDDDAPVAPPTKHLRDQKGAARRIGGLVIVNALIFQETLSQHDNRVSSLRRLIEKNEKEKGDLIGAFCQLWQLIMDEIDYYPIFNVAKEVMLDLSAHADTLRAFRGLAHTAQQIVSNRAALRHDLMGRIYHRLLADAKYLGTYYTSIPAAAMLLRLAFQPEQWPLAWGQVSDLEKLRVADLSCGTGTLLTAAADAITHNYINAMVDKGEPVVYDELQKVLAEKILYGYDVLPSAIHLTASTLALRAPEKSFDQMNLFSLPLGGTDLRLGSIEFLQNETISFLDLFGAASAQQVTGKGVKDRREAPMPELDLAVMNPPFVRSVGGNLLFGSMPESERKPMQKKLQKLVRNNEWTNTTAGLGSIFVAAAHNHIKVGGRLALILPKALLSGVAWANTRDLINRHYQIEYLIASHDSERWNFSESTSLSEVMLIAVKRDHVTTTSGENPGHTNASSSTKVYTIPNPLVHKRRRANEVTAVNLWRNPTTAFEALAVTNALLSGEQHGQTLMNGQGALDIRLGEQKLGEAVQIPWETVKHNWLLPCGFAQSDLTRIAYHLLEGRLWMPGFGEQGQIPLCRLDYLGSLGPDRRDIHDGFSLSNSPTPYAAFWGHNAEEMTTIGQQPNRYLMPLQAAKKSRPLRRVESLWPLAGRILIAERLWLTTQCLFTVCLDQPVLSNTWWSFTLRANAKDHTQKALGLWMNSTLANIIFLSHRVETRGAWIDFKKPTLEALPVLDVRTLTENQMVRLAAAYDAVAHQDLQPFPQMAADPVRAEIDRSLAEVFGWPDLGRLRVILAREPVVCMRRL